MNGQIRFAAARDHLCQLSPLPTKLEQTIAALRRLASLWQFFAAVYSFSKNLERLKRSAGASLSSMMHRQISEATAGLVKDSVHARYSVVRSTGVQDNAGTASKQGNPVTGVRIRLVMNGLWRKCSLLKLSAVSASERLQTRGFLQPMIFC